MDILKILESFNKRTELFSEAEYNRAVENMQLEILDVDKFVKRNDVQEITNPVFFQYEGVPTEDGLLSNEIFGITKETRAGTYGYIALHGTFMDPSCYKCWTRLDSKVKACVQGTDTFIINSKGELESNPNGSNGIDFLKKNFDNIKIKSTDSRKRDIKINYLKSNKDKMFITKYIVIPVYYRDVSSGKNTGVGEINRLYSQLIIAVRAYTDIKDYGISTSAQAGRIQNILLAIYDWFAGNSNTMLKESGAGMAAKNGIIRSSVLSKTADYSNRLVISAPELKVETVDDLMVDTFHAALPLSAAITNFKPYILFHVRRFFENNFDGIATIETVDKKTGKIIRVTPKDPKIEFSDERIMNEIHKYVHSYSDRFVPITFHVEENDKAYSMIFKGHKSTEKANELVESISNRRLCWIDLFYQAAVEATKDKCILITRFPIDSFYNQFPNEIVVSSTKETEPMIINGTLYPYYPKIREEDIGKDTSNSFIDTLSMANVQLDSIGGDYDGDQVTTKGAYYKESNEELKKYLHSKEFFLSANGINIRLPGNDTYQTLYSLTKILDNEKQLTNPVF